MGGEIPDDFTKATPPVVYREVVPGKSLYMVTVNEWEWLWRVSVAFMVWLCLLTMACVYLLGQVQLLSKQVETLERLEGLDRVMVERVSK